MEETKKVIKLNAFDWKGYLEEAKSLSTLYDEQNSHAPEKPYIYGSIDNVMLRLFERRHGILITSMRTNGPEKSVETYLYGVEGFFNGTENWLVGGLPPANNFELYTNNKTAKVKIENFESGVISKLRVSLCDILTWRSQRSPEEFKKLFPPNTTKYLLAIKKQALHYVA